MSMLSNRPYLLRAFYDWIEDSKCTPIIVIDALKPNCKVPQNFVQDNEIVLNVSSHAIRDLKISNIEVKFNASFSGVVHFISAPITSVLALYAEENEEGIYFEDEEVDGSAKITPQPFQLVGNQNISISDKIELNSDLAQKKPMLKLVDK